MKTTNYFNLILMLSVKWYLENIHIIYYIKEENYMLKVIDYEKLKKASSEITVSNEDMESIAKDQDPPKRKRGRPKKSEQQKQEIVLSENGNSVEVIDNNVPLCESNLPYNNTYGETNYMLRESIGQINMISAAVQSEIENLKNSKTIKGKYKYMADLCSTASNLVSTKLSAVKEINNTITTCHKLEMQRLKDIKNLQSQQQDDDKYMADLYNAYINTPINQGQAASFLNMNAANTINNQVMMGQATPLYGNSDDGYNDYLNNMTPEQNRMLLDGNPNIETVVVYDPNTGAKSFDVIDTSTGNPVPNFPRPVESLLDDTIIDFHSGIASNSNIGMNWKVVALSDPLSKF